MCNCITKTISTVKQNLMETNCISLKCYQTIIWVLHLLECFLVLADFIRASLHCLINHGHDYICSPLLISILCGRSWYSDFHGYDDSMMHVPAVYLPVWAAATASTTALKSLNIITALLSCFTWFWSLSWKIKSPKPLASKQDIGI